MRIRIHAALVAVIVVLVLPGLASAQDDQVGQQGAVWNLGELAQGTYPSTVTAVNESCPGPHDFHVSLLGEAADFITIIGPSVLTGIPPGQSKTSEVFLDLRATAPGQHNEGEIAVRCVDCPVTCSQDYDLLAVQLTVVADANAAPPRESTADPFWGGIDLTLPNSSRAPAEQVTDDMPGIRWVLEEAFDRMTLATDAIDEGLADISFTGTGHAAGQVFYVEITRNAETPFEMGFPLGTLVVPDDPQYSPMMVGDNGAVALLEEVTTVTVFGFQLDPNLEQPPTAEQATGGGPSWTVQPPPESGPFATAVALIEAAFEISGQFSTEVPLDNYFNVVVQRAIWAEADPDEQDEEHLREDILAQLSVVGKVAEPDQVEDASEAIWNDLSQVANLGKSR